ncbi:hypothetical protein Droror1_Dr00011644 [Drosera rotundifolia]
MNNKKKFRITNTDALEPSLSPKAKTQKHYTLAPQQRSPSPTTHNPQLKPKPKAATTTAMSPPAPPRKPSAATSSSTSAASPNPSIKAPLHPDSFLNELTAMFERSTEKGSVWVTFKRSSLKTKVQTNKMKSAGESIEYKCLVRATDGKKKITTTVGVKDHQRFQASYATVLKAHMTALKKRERKDRKKVTDADKKPAPKKKKSSTPKTSKENS